MRQGYPLASRKSCPHGRPAGSAPDLLAAGYDGRLSEALSGKARHTTRGRHFYPDV